ncbi:unnamed protein product, partial [Ilex paraguariensis]
MAYRLALPPELAAIHDVNLSIMRFISASSLASLSAFLFLESSNLLCPIPMSTDLETRAKEAFINDHFELAVDLYCQAIAMNPKNAELFADRAQAYIKFCHFP